MDLSGGLKDEIDCLLGQGRNQAAVDLLRHLIAQDPDCAPAYARLGIAYLRLGDFTQSLYFCRQACAREPTNWAGFEGLAEACGYLRRDADASRAGRRALALKDASVAPAAATPVLVQPQTGRPIIAYSLFGALPRYCETSLLNVAAVPALFPGWLCRFYVDETVPPAIIGKLTAAGAEIVRIPPEQADLPGTMWRFLALADRQASAILCRDADSLLNRRDAEFVDAWMRSGLPFHVIRDHFGHTDLMMAGLIGVRGGILGDIEAAMRQWLASADGRDRWADQKFLRERIWSIARDGALTHDPWFRFGRHVVSDTVRVADIHDHVGANLSSQSMRLELAFPDGSAVEWTLVDGDGREICRYGGVIIGGAHEMQIPRPYGAKIESGAWKLHWRVTPADRADNR